MSAPPLNSKKMEFLGGGRNLCINGGNFLQVAGDMLGPITDNSDKGIEALCARVASRAFFNSSERGDPPTCYPETRVAILQKIMEWLDHRDANNTEPGQILSMSTSEDGESEVNFDLNQSAMWLHGPAGSGKTAIAQTIAQLCFEIGRLSSTFFFSRAAISSETSLVPTLAYEISKYIPEVKPFISAAILNDRFIFGLSMESQINSLIITPLSQITDVTPMAPKLIIIDGLDECLNRDAQCIIINSFVAALNRFPEQIPHKLLIASRPEHQLVSAFSRQHIMPSVAHLPLRDTMQAYDDVRYFIQKSLAEVKEKHILSSRLPEVWPSDKDISTLVTKSSGHFIYASTVIKYVTSGQHNPADRLGVILGLKVDLNNKPYADLDALYSHILSKIEDIQTVKLIFRIVLANTLARPGSSTPNISASGDHFKAAEYLLELPEGKVELKLIDLFGILISVSQPPEPRKIKFIHASFTDYLIDPSRSGKFCVNDEYLCLDLAKYCIALATENRNLYEAGDHVQELRFCYDMLIHVMESIPSNGCQRRYVYQLLSQMDLRAAFARMTNTHSNRDSAVLSSMTRFISWVVERYTSTNSDYASVLEGFITNLQDWFFTQLKTFPFNGIDNSARVDLTVFAMIPLLYDQDAVILYPLKDIFREVDWNGNFIQASFIPEVALCWRMMQKLACFFENEKLAGVYTMTEKRYTDAARHCLGYIFPETSSWKKWRAKRSLHTSGESYERAMECVAFLLSRSAPHFQLFSICNESLKTGGEVNDYEPANQFILQGNVDPLTKLVDAHVDNEMLKVGVPSTAKPLCLSWEIAKYLVRCGQNPDILNPPTSQNWSWVQVSQALVRRNTKPRKTNYI